MLPAVEISYCILAGIVDGELAMFCPGTRSFTFYSLFHLAGARISYSNPPHEPEKASTRDEGPVPKTDLSLVSTLREAGGVGRTHRGFAALSRDGIKHTGGQGVKDSTYSTCASVLVLLVCAGIKARLQGLSGLQGNGKRISDYQKHSQPCRVSEVGGITLQCMRAKTVAPEKKEPLD